jgi:hypothetical protein
MRRQRWRDLSGVQRRLIVAAGTVQLSLAAFAWWDLARRDAAEVRGPKRVWAPVIAVNFAGPLTYLTAGRRRDG